MDSKTRIDAVLNAKNLEKAVTGFSSFDLSTLIVSQEIDFSLPYHLRLGHLVEHIVSQLIKSSTNYKVLYENIQIVENKITVGEIDFIIQEIETSQNIHLELAYKFYLLDSNISSVVNQCWIGPNRKDSLNEKLDKLYTKQFPLLSHNATVSMFEELNISEVSQALCFLVSLFVPYQMKLNLDPVYDKYVRGYFINIDTFLTLDHTGCEYHIPEKKNWGINPSVNKIWDDLGQISHALRNCLKQKQSPLCWKKQNDLYSEFFVVWW